MTAIEVSDRRAHQVRRWSRCAGFVWRPALAALLAMLAVDLAGGRASAGGSGWSGATAISPVGNRDPTRDSQLNDVAVNTSGLAVAA